MGFTSFLSLSFNLFHIPICLKNFLLLVHNLSGFHPTHNDQTPKSTTTRISIRNTSPSLSMTYNGWKECTFEPRASRIFPLWSVHPPDEKLTRMSSSSSSLAEINGLESSGMCQTLCSTNVEPTRRLSSIVPIPIIDQRYKFSTPTESECRFDYSRNWDL